MEDLSKIFGTRVKELRMAKNYSQDEYANFVGINLKTLWNIETGKRSIHFDTIKKIIEAEKIPVYKLFLTNKEKEEDINKEILRLINKLDTKELHTIKELLQIITKTN